MSYLNITREMSNVSSKTRNMLGHFIGKGRFLKYLRQPAHKEYIQISISKLFTFSLIFFFLAPVETLRNVERLPNQVGQSNISLKGKLNLLKLFGTIFF